MTLTIELTPEEAEKLHRLAQAKGTDEAGALRGLLAEAPPKPKTGAEAVAFWKKEKVLGIWQDRPDSPELAQELRRQAETRDWSDAARYYVR
jgi:hypothetical protein